jgi:hypothetical protein
MHALEQELMNNMSQPSLLADSVSRIAQLYRDLAAKTDELGDPPNGEGKGGASAGAEVLRSFAKQIEQISADIRSTKTRDDLAVNFNKYSQTLSNVGPTIHEFKAKYSAPELEKVEKGIPGCYTGD